MTSTKSIRIMIIDDHPEVRVGLAGMLSTQPDIQVVGSASSGLEALTLLDAITPDVVLMDLRMSGMSGLETIRAINLLNDPPRIIVLTSFDTDEDIYQWCGCARLRPERYSPRPIAGSYPSCSLEKTLFPG